MEIKRFFVKPTVPEPPSLPSIPRLSRRLFIKEGTTKLAKETAQITGYATAAGSIGSLLFEDVRKAHWDEQAANPLKNRGVIWKATAIAGGYALGRFAERASSKDETDNNP